MRADKFLAERFGSRTKAAEAIEKGLVLVNGKTVRTKDEVSEQDEIIVLQAEEQFVSNGGYKLQRAIKTFAYDCNGKVFADLGASTGGFTDCLLQNGAKKVYTVDVGESLLHESLYNDERVVRMENTNARYLTDADFPEKIDGIVADVSFISLRLIFPTISKILDGQGDVFALIKPQFECEKKNIGKSGIVHTFAHADIVDKVCGYAEENALYPRAIVNAPIRKGKNVEYVVWLSPEKKGAASKKQILDTVRSLLKSENNSESK